MKQYKVLTQGDRLFGGKFSPERLEHALNACAAEGWQLKAAATTDVPRLGRARQEMVMMLERDSR